MNDALAIATGTSMEDLVESHPTEAYLFIRDVMIEWLGQTVASAVFYLEDGRKITSEDDGNAANLAIQSSVENNLSTVIVQPIDVTIFAIANQDDPGGMLLKFSVEPPDYAF